MPPIAFSTKIQINGQTFRVRRLDGSRSGAATFIPKLVGQRSGVQLDPLNDTDWSDGRGWGQNNDMSEGMGLPGPLVTSVALPSQPGADLEQFAEQDGHIYAVGGRYAYKIASGSGAPSQDRDLGATFGAVSITPWKSNLIVGGRASGNIWELPSGGAWTNTMVSGAVHRGKLTTVWWNTGGGNSLRLVGEGANPTDLTYVAANPLLDTDWVSAITIGAYPIRSMVANRFHAYAATTGGLFDFGSDGTAPNLTPEIEHMVMDTNGRATLAAEGWIYINAGYTLFRVRGIGQDYALPQECGWSTQLPKECPMSGYCTAIVKYGKWLWAFVYDGTNTWGIKGREAGPNDQYGPIVWFIAPIYLPGVKVSAAHVSGLVSGNPRLWMAVSDGATRALRWAPLPLDSAYRDLRQARQYRFSTSYQYDLPDQDHGDDSLVKLYSETVAENENCGSGASIDVSIASDGTTAFTAIGSVRTNPRATVRPGSETRYMRHIMRLTGSGTTSTPPVLRKLTRRAFPRPDLTEVRQYQAIVGHAVRHSGGNLDGRDVSNARTSLGRLQTAGYATMRDEHGHLMTVLVAPGETLTEVDATFGDEADARVLVADLQVAVVSTVVGGHTAKWGTGVKWGTPGCVYA
jgi:hypothetical protein